MRACCRDLERDLLRCCFVEGVSLWKGWGVAVGSLATLSPPSPALGAVAAMFDPSSGRRYRNAAIGKSHRCSILDRRYSTIALGRSGLQNRCPWGEADASEIWSPLQCRRPRSGRCYSVVAAATVPSSLGDLIASTVSSPFARRRKPTLQELDRLREIWSSLQYRRPRSGPPPLQYRRPSPVGESRCCRSRIVLGRYGRCYSIAAAATLPSSKIWSPLQYRRQYISIIW